MNGCRSNNQRHASRVRITANLVAALVMLVGVSTPALAITCSTWTPAQGEERDPAFEAAVDELLNSPKAAQWTTLNKPIVKECLMASRRRIQAEFDGLCAKGMQAGMQDLDNKLYDYALGCVRA